MGQGGGSERGAGRSLVASMVHDLKNPLSALAGNLALLREELGEIEPSPVASRCLGDAVALCDRVLRMVQSLADVDAAERGTMRIHPERTRLRALVDAAVRLVEVDAGTREQTVDVEVDVELEAEVDGRLLGQVIQNLIDNAVRYAPRRGRVAIRASVGEDALTLAVGNSGPALTAAERAAVFEPGFRIAERAAGARRGRDFGLYFGRVVIEAHGGTLSYAQEVGLPTVFVVRLPTPVRRATP